jgi:hypothetical protein
LVEEEFSHYKNIFEREPPNFLLSAVCSKVKKIRESWERASMIPSVGDY